MLPIATIVEIHSPHWGKPYRDLDPIPRPYNSTETYSSPSSIYLLGAPLK